MSAIATLRAAYRDRHALLRAWKRDNGARVVGYVGGGVPVELIHAAGMLPVRLAGDPYREPAAVEPLAGAGADPWAKAVAAQLLDGTYDYCDQVVIGSVPTVLASLYNFFVEARRIDPAFDGPRPWLHDAPEGVNPAVDPFAIESVRLLRDRLAAWRGATIDDRALAAGVARADAVRIALARLEAHRAARRIGGSDALAATGAALAAPIPAVLDALAELNAALDAAPALPGVPIILSGSDVETLDLHDRLEALGLLTVADDQDWGSRAAFGATAAAAPSPASIATTYRRRPPAPASARVEERIAYLRDLVARTGARAVVFRILAIDHPAAWDHPRLRDALAADGVPSVELGPLRYRDPLPASALDALGAFVRSLAA